MRSRAPRSALRLAAAGGAGLLASVGCTSADPSAAGGDEIVESVVVVEGLSGPTQLFVDGDEWLVAQLAGGENEQLGQILAIDPADPGEHRVLIAGLDKPTGVARFDGDVWVMASDRLLRFDIGVGATPATPLSPDDASIAAGPLPNNGRSEGSLSVIDDHLIFDTSGTLRGEEVADDAGRLWSIDGAGRITELGSGFKHAYAHVELPDGSILVTEMSDGSFDGRPAADAVLRLEEGADHGWPRCVAQTTVLERRAVEAFGGTTDECAALPPLLASFDAGATPTSVAVIPWDTSRVAVALWNRSEVVSVSIETGAVAPMIDQNRPQHLVADGGRLLVVDHEEGRIYSLSV